jgi:hypothetical protein
MLHPGTALYVGYNNGLNNLFLDESVIPSQVIYQRSVANSNTQLFFVKFSYLFRF